MYGMIFLRFIFYNVSFVLIRKWYGNTGVKISVRVQ